MNEQPDLFGRRRAFDAGILRTTLIGLTRVPYVLQRGRRRLSMRIDERGLFVGAPQGLPLAEIEAFLQRHAQWVLSRLASFAQRPQRFALQAGARLPVLGRMAEVQLCFGANRGYWQEDGERLILWLACRDASQAPRLARQALDRRLLDHCAPLVRRYAAQLGLPTPRLALSSARRRWGSCSRKSGIRLSRRLVHLPESLVEYVIVHEVAHLIEMNHGPRFWALVAVLLPDWRTRRDELRHFGKALPDL